MPMQVVSAVYSAARHLSGVIKPNFSSRQGGCIVCCRRKSSIHQLYQRAHYQYPGALDCWDRMTPQRIRYWWIIERFRAAYSGRRVLQPQEIADYTQALPVL